MGQYYFPVSMDKEESVYSWDYASGLKLMEHSWLLNDFVGAVESLLIKGGRWYKNKIVWAGDYADGELAAEPDENGRHPNLYHLFHEKNIKPKATVVDEMILVNHTKKEFVDKTKVPEDSDDWRIHPLPLLTCEGNGRGGGDYQGNSNLVGSWARDVISLSATKPKGYKELDFNLVE